MADTSPNIGLKKPLENEFVDIGIINGNMDKIDQSLGQMSNLPTAAKDAAGAISEIHDQLRHKPGVPIALNNGVQIVQGGDVPAILHPSMIGRTLINLLGRDGNCEQLNIWNSYQNTHSLVTTNVKYGNNAMRLTLNPAAAGGYGSAWRYFSIVGGKTYLLLFEGKVGTGTKMAVGVSGGDGATIGNEVTDTTKYCISYLTWTAPDSIMRQFSIYSYGADNTFNYVDGARLFEITATEKMYIDGLSVLTAQSYIESKYPYVDDMKHVNSVFMRNPGKNLLPLFSEWTQYSGTSTVTEFNTLSLDANSTVQMDVPCMPNYDYTFSVTNVGGGRILIATFDISMSLIAQSNYVVGSSISKVTEVNAKYIRVVLDTTGLSAKGFTNPMLNIGSIAIPFEPQKPSYLYLPDCNLRSNVEGSIADKLYTDGQGKPRVSRRFRETILDGTLMYTHDGDYTGYKRVNTSSIGGWVGDTTANIGIKYDGKLLTSVTNVPTFYDAVRFNNAGILYIYIADTDSGWGESYSPSQDEIKAYFNGWRMHLDGSGYQTPFNGMGTRGWHYRVDGVTNPSAGNGTLILPTTQAPSFTPYRLMYQLAQSVDEAVNYEGSLMLQEGANQIEVGTGIVVQEAAKPLTNGTSYYLNRTDVAGSNFKRRALRTIKIYKNGNIDTVWKIDNNSAGSSVVNGSSWAMTLNANLDPTAAYSVTYLALDTYALGIAPHSINAEYAPNIRESVESMVREVVEARTEISVLRNTKVQKQLPQWVVPTLSNGWTSAGGIPVKYSKDDSGNVIIDGYCWGGVATEGTTIFLLPRDYRPTERVLRAVLSHVPDIASPYIIVGTNGEVKIYKVAVGGTNNDFFMNGVSFRAAQ
ncbi:hypothetical protein [Cohnella herbarum]|uniref:Uncharacterized protein n=1 Tax=Cohnella herbarum TaxID=2728023 RepID=A0A7Z2VPK2_9BACL|nr:hypothetical protein [Cohnella herbarum]QJD86725.1 hypothetical protein HH215_28515 [Cohnella herbarum]